MPLFRSESGSTLLVRLVVLCLMTAGIVVAAPPTAEAAEPQRYEPRGKRRVVTYYDPQGLWSATLPRGNATAEKWLEDPESWKKAIETVVHAHAEAKIDTIVHCVFARFETNMPPGVTRIAQPIYEQVPWTRPLEAMEKAGYDVVQIMLDQAHKDGLTFMAGLRMNDRHGIAYITYVSEGIEHKAKAYFDHPEWHLKGAPGGFDYSNEDFRETMLAFVKDVLDKYDVDGIEYDWMRQIFIFPEGTERRNAPLLTDFHRRTRLLLDEAGKRRGRRLLLSARVPDSLKECTEFGYAVEQWIRQGLVDYIVPSGFGNMDFNVRVEDFRKLTEGTDCRVYPAVNLWPGPCRLTKSGGWRPEHYYAAAHNYYGFGADGIATYNYYYASMEDRLPKLFDLTPITDPTVLARQFRDYLFWRRLPGRRPVKHPGESPHYDVMHLGRSEGVHGSESRGTFDFRLAEDFTKGDHSAVMEFKAVGILEGDAFEVALNGLEVAPDRIKRLHVWDGKDWQDNPEPYDLFRIRLMPGEVVWGDNEFAVSLKSESLNGSVRIEEVNVKVQPG